MGQENSSTKGAGLEGSGSKRPERRALSGKKETPSPIPDHLFDALKIIEFQKDARRQAVPAKALIQEVREATERCRKDQNLFGQVWKGVRGKAGGSQLPGATQKDFFTEKRKTSQVSGVGYGIDNPEIHISLRINSAIS